MEVTNYWMYMATKPVPAGVTVAIRIEAFDYPEMKAYFEK